MTTRRTVELRVAGQSYRVVSSAPEPELHRLASTITERVFEVSPPGRPIPPQALVLAAMALAHDLEDERAQRRDLERRSRDLLRRVLVRIDEALENCDEQAAAQLE